MPDPMSLLKDGVPLSLVVDLFEADGPRAADIYADEGADMSWTAEVPRQRW